MVLNQCVFPTADHDQVDAFRFRPGRNRERQGAAASLKYEMLLSFETTYNPSLGRMRPLSVRLRSRARPGGSDSHWRLRLRPGLRRHAPASRWRDWELVLRYDTQPAAQAVTAWGRPPACNSKFSASVRHDPACAKCRRAGPGSGCLAGPGSRPGRLVAGQAEPRRRGGLPGTHKARSSPNSGRIRSSKFGPGLEDSDSESDES